MPARVKGNSSGEVRTGRRSRKLPDLAFQKSSGPRS